VEVTDVRTGVEGGAGSAHPDEKSFSKKLRDKKERSSDKTEEKNSKSSQNVRKKGGQEP